jgi:hypothetical protein
MRSTRVIEGFIYWGGGSPRFIYAPSKLNPDAPTWMANKFQTAMPRALFGYRSPDQLNAAALLVASVPSVILFSAAELMVGAIADGGSPDARSRVAVDGFCWRCSAGRARSASTNAPWPLLQSMGTTLLLDGSGAWSIDNALIRRNPALAARHWFRWMAGNLPLPFTEVDFRNVAL